MEPTRPPVTETGEPFSATVAGALAIPTSAGPGVAPILTVQGLRKRFGARQAVDDVSFQIGRGETYGLLGPNGGLAIVRFRRVLLAGG